ncbi:hypothetical protein [Pseudoalteromonas marina]|uniref:Uncharacterized protein n=1 Tax=Pseudoalteromonas marina TaxID=267375 RepID=A0ABT9FG57_9GAMM|nr:hypothetical protein [Pseudoalteromonas marina]MDP2565764.1 hypothetical protein [Pseudoalteromonas marina]
MTSSNYVQPIRCKISFSDNRRVKYTKTSLLLVPSAFSSICFMLGVFFGCVSIFMAFYLVFFHDLFGAFLFFLIGYVLFGLARLLYLKKVIIEFNSELNRLVVFDQIIKFQDLVRVELLEKVVEPGPQEFPYHSAEVRVTTAQGECYLLAQSSNQEKMSIMAKEIAEYVGLPFVTDGTLYRL